MDAEALELNPEWVPEAAGSAVSLPPSEVHLWRQSLVLKADLRDRYRQFLHRDELARAHRYVTADLQHRFIAGRGFLRQVLANVVNEDPGELHFSYGPQGKPALVNHPDLAFNLSHSGDVAVLGVVRGRTVGVDVEFENPIREYESITRRYFAKAEIEALFGLPESQRHQAFYRCWTRKEAYLKAKGGGLTFPLDRFVVSLRPDEAPALLTTELDDPGSPDATAEWSVLAFRAAVDVAGAVFVSGAPLTPVFREIPT